MNWYEVKNTDKILSPALSIYPNRISKNIQQMIDMVGSSERLRPHVKTYKMPQIIQMQMEMGINKYKCSTLAELQMVIDAGAIDILYAMPCIGPNQDRFIDIMIAHPQVVISTLIDDIDQCDEWSKKATDRGININLYVDLNVGMNRTGIAPNKAMPLIKKIERSHQLTLSGLHVYDGHIRIKGPIERDKETLRAYLGVDSLLAEHGSTEQWEIVCGGSITFPCHATHQRRTCSPGTTLLWDYGYGSTFEDIPMLNAAVLISRIISKPGDDRLCLDLGHKAVGSEMQEKRIHLLNIPNYERVGHSEEHLIISVPNRDQYQIGDVIYGLPWHICPTVALHDSVHVIKDNKLHGLWVVAARHRVH